MGNAGAANSQSSGDTLPAVSPCTLPYSLNTFVDLARHGRGSLVPRPHPAHARRRGPVSQVG